MIECAQTSLDRHELRWRAPGKLKKSPLVQKVTNTIGRDPSRTKDKPVRSFPTWGFLRPEAKLRKPTLLDGSILKSAYREAAEEATNSLKAPHWR